MAVATAWLLLIALLLGFQAAGYNIGFNVWWGGETRNWLSFLQDGQGSQIAKTFWQLDNRNPLSPWWYIPFRSFILSTPSAFLVLHLGTSLLLGVASYLAVMGVTAGRGRMYGVALGMLAAVFLCSTKIDSIHWNFIGALACSLLCVWCFAQFLNSGRSRPHWLGWSLVFWLVAVQTYTIQSGGVLAVAALSLTQGGRPYGLHDLGKRFVRTIADALPFASTLLMFILVWRTTSAGLTESTTPPDLGLVGQSLAQGLWHRDFAAYMAWARQLPPSVVVFVLAGATPLLAGAQAVVGRTADHEAVPIGALDLARVLLVGICLVVPTVALEATSSMFPPGTRWVMVLQFWAPLLTLSVAAAVVLVLPVSSRLKRGAWHLVAAGCVAGAILLTLGSNRMQTLVSRDEQAFLAALRQVAIEDKAAGAEFPRHYIVKSASGYWLPSDYLSRVYSKTQMRDVGDVTYRHLLTVPAGYGLAFLPDRVENPEAFQQGSAPYSRVGVLAWDGARMTRLSGADRSAFEGLKLEWKRDAPLP